MPTKETQAILNDIGTEELAHLEMVGTMVHQLTRVFPADVLEKERRTWCPITLTMIRLCTPWAQQERLYRSLYPVERRRNS